MSNSQNNNRILHLVKTLDGATWAFHQIKGLIECGYEVHVATPSLEGKHKADLLSTGAILHKLPIDFPNKKPWRLLTQSKNIQSFIEELNPRLIHSHFVSNTLMMRWCLKKLNIPRIFQVPGPLHLEHGIFGQWEIIWSDENDFWIASSNFIRELYIKKYHLPADKIFLSYYGIDLNPPPNNTPFLRKEFGIPSDAKLLGNVSYIYPPKLFLGQTIGLKGHELILKNVANLLNKHPNLWMIFIGNQWGKDQSYFNKLKEHADKIGQGRIIFAGLMPHSKVLQAWKEIDLAIHVPFSENCGGVVEPLLVDTPVLAANVGGIPEVISNLETGLLCFRNDDSFTQQLYYALEHEDKMKLFAKQGHQRILKLFERKKTAQQIHNIYQKILYNQ